MSCCLVTDSWINASYAYIINLYIRMLFMHNVNPVEAKIEYDNHTPFIDVREENEHRQARIPNSTLIPLSQMQNRWQEIPKDKKVVIYCQSGNRSASLIMELERLGYENLMNLYGGIIAWHRGNMPVEFG